MEEFASNEHQVEGLIMDLKSMFESFVWEKEFITNSGEEPDYFDELINLK